MHSRSAPDFSAIHGHNLTQYIAETSLQDPLYVSEVCRGKVILCNNLWFVQPFHQTMSFLIADITERVYNIIDVSQR